jgi:hypothetical protein
MIDSVLQYMMKREFLKCVEQYVEQIWEKLIFEEGGALNKTGRE